MEIYYKLYFFKFEWSGFQKFLRGSEKNFVPELVIVCDLGKGIFKYEFW